MEDLHGSDVALDYPPPGLTGLVHIVDAVREEERRELARELHDTAVQPLASLIVGLALFERQPDAVRSLETFIDTWKQQAQEALDAVRSAMMGLSWQLSINTGLVGALQSRLVPQLRQWGIALTIEDRSWPIDLPVAWTSQLYLIVREALTNVAKHACASEARVILDCDSRGLALVIQDDGRGFRWEERTSRSPQFAGSGLGIAGMQSRVHSLLGHLEISTAPGVGTRIEIILPNPTTSRRRQATPEMDRGLPAGQDHRQRQPGA